MTSKEKDIRIGQLESMLRAIAMLPTDWNQDGSNPYARDIEASCRQDGRERCADELNEKLGEFANPKCGVCGAPVGYALPDRCHEHREQV